MRLIILLNRVVQVQQRLKEHVQVKVQQPSVKIQRNPLRVQLDRLVQQLNRSNNRTLLRLRIHIDQLTMTPALLNNRVHLQQVRLLVLRKQRTSFLKTPKRLIRFLSLNTRQPQRDVLVELTGFVQLNFLLSHIQIRHRLMVILKHNIPIRSVDIRKPNQFELIQRLLNLNL